MSCIAPSTFGRTSPNWAATASLAGTTKLFMASKTPTFVRHFPPSNIFSKVSNTMRVDSGGHNFKMDLTADVAAKRTTSPLSIYRSNKMGREGSNRGMHGEPRMVARE